MYHLGLDLVLIRPFRELDFRGDGLALDFDDLHGQGTLEAYEEKL